MIELIVARNEVNYTGTLERPAFSLWGNGGTILGGLYDAFSRFNVKFSDIRGEQTSVNPSDQAVTVLFGLEGLYRFRFDRIELYFQNVSEETINHLPEYLTAGESWLRHAASDIRFKTHQIQYAAHAHLTEGRVGEFLNRLANPTFVVEGTETQAGLIIRWLEPKCGWLLQLILDHSLLITDGLYLSFGVTVAADKVDFTDVVPMSRSILEGQLRSLGLAFKSD